MAQSPGPPPAPLCLPETPSPGALLSPESSEPRLPVHPAPIQRTEEPPIQSAADKGLRAGPPGKGARAGDRCPSRPRLTLRAGGLRRRLAGSPGGAAEQQRQQR